MTHCFSFALLLRRPYDSAPPEGRVSFLADGIPAAPALKPGGLYVFSDCAARTVGVYARGFQREQVFPVQGAVSPVFLYPEEPYDPPSGWRTVTGAAPPGSMLVAADGREVRLLDCGRASAEVRLWARQGFLGGALLLACAGGRELARIIEKRPPDRYLLDRISRDYTGGRAALVYPARANRLGVYTAVLPEALDGADIEVWKGE